MAGQCQDDANAQLFIVKAVHLKRFVSVDTNVHAITFGGDC